MPLQRCVFAWRVEFQGAEQVALIRGHAPGADDVLLVDHDVVLLDLSEQRHRAARREGMVAGAQSLAHHPVQRQRKKADQRVRADAFGQAMVHGCDLDVALEHAEAALDISQRLVTVDDFAGVEIGVGDQQQFPIELLGILDRVFVDRLRPRSAQWSRAGRRVAPVRASGHAR